MLKYLIFIVVIVAANTAWFASEGPAWLQTQLATKPTLDTARSFTNPDLIDSFIKTIKTSVEETYGKPTEGYVPSMFLETFPGLTSTDFAGAAASSGKYEMINGRLVHSVNKDALSYNASAALQREGFATVLENVAVRAGIDLDSQGTLTEIMAVISTP